MLFISWFHFESQTSCRETPDTRLLKTETRLYTVSDTHFRNMLNGDFPARFWLTPILTNLNGNNRGCGGGGGGGFKSSSNLGTSCFFLDFGTSYIACLMDLWFLIYTNIGMMVHPNFGVVNVNPWNTDPFKFSCLNSLLVHKQQHLYC